MTRGLTLFVLCALWGGPAGAQTAAVTVTQSGGASSESLVSVGTQVRALMEPAKDFRLNAEVAWGDRSRGDLNTDAFGTAYPYAGKTQVMEAWAEYVLPRGRGLRAIKVGRYRTPFGISAASDHAYLGFLRPPLIRYGTYWALSNGYFEHGIDVVVGVPRAALEVSVGRPSDVGDALRADGIDTVARAEGVLGSLVVGASYINTSPYLRRSFVKGRARFGGVDARWMRGGVQMRGEWLAGRPFDGTTTTGGYVDAIVHTPRMGPVTGLVRLERLDYDTDPRFALHSYRYGAGLRVRVWQRLAASVGLIHQGGQVTQRRATALDLGLTLTLRKNITGGP
jgi:hypothetical protein